MRSTALQSAPGEVEMIRRKRGRPSGYRAAVGCVKRGSRPTARAEADGIRPPYLVARWRAIVAARARLERVVADSDPGLQQAEARLDDGGGLVLRREALEAGRREAIDEDVSRRPGPGLDVSAERVPVTQPAEVAQQRRGGEVGLRMSSAQLIPDPDEVALCW
jgi:hypothetical protein